jgi:hypothetical protein
MDSPGALWGELGKCEHVLQVHDDDAAFIASLGAFVADGLARKVRAFWTRGKHNGTLRLAHHRTVGWQE